MKVKQSEKDIEELILEWLNYQHGCFAFKMNVKGVWDEQRSCYRKPGKFVPVGGSDIIGLLRGRFFCFEVKTPSEHKKLLSSPGEHELRQLSFIQQVQAKGGIGAFVSSLEQVQEVIKKSLPKVMPTAVHTPLVLT